MLAAFLVTVVIHGSAGSALLWMGGEKEVHQLLEPLDVSLVTVPPRPQPPPPKPRKPVVKPVPKPVPVEPEPAIEPEPQVEEPVIPEENTALINPGPIQEEAMVPVDLPIEPPRYGADYLNNPVPPYPAMAKRLRIEGTVVIRVLVSPSGLPQEVELAHTSGSVLLDEAAMKAVQRWTFIPARQGNKPIAAMVEIPIHFHLN